MRIYILSTTNLIKNQTEQKLTPYFHKTTYIDYIWSINGLFQVENNKIYRIKIQDKAAEKTLLGAFPATIDRSEFIREEECYQITPRSFKEYTKVTSYRLTPSSSLEWILEYRNNELHDNYFYLPPNTNTNANTNANTNINELSLLSEHILQPTLQEQTQPKQQYPAPLVYKSHCNARIWGFIYDKTTLKQIISLDKIYKVKYTTKFKLNDFNNKYILGSRCMRNLDMPDNIYCHQHIQHLTHGNYNDVPDAEMCIHFIKDGKYLLNRI